jgi:hypothetical protein
MLQKDGAEHAVPEPLRSTFRRIAGAFVDGDYQLRDRPIAGVRPVEPDTAKWIAECVSAYGDDLAPLDEQTWERSVYRWMDGYWLALVDLTTGSEPVSDLSLHAKLFEGGDVEVYGVFVP